MKPESRISIRNSIATRLLRIVFSFYLVIAIGVTLGHMVLEYRYQRNNISRDLEDIQKTFERGLAIDLWQLNEESLRSTVEGMLEIPVIVGVKIRDANGVDIAVGGIIAQGDVIGNVGRHVSLLGVNQEESEVQEDEIYTLDVFMHRFPIVYTYKDEAKQLGEATIYSNTSVVFRRVKLGFSLLVINAVVKTIALWFIFLWFSTLLLRRPLASLASAVGNVNLENLDSFSVKIETSGRNELKVLEESFNSMIGNLHRSMVEGGHAEEALRESEKKYRFLAENAADVIWTRDLNLNTTYLSPSVEKLTGFSVEEALAMPDSDRMTPASAKLSVETLLEELALEEGGDADPARTRILEAEMLCKDGSTVWVETTMSFIRDPSGQAVGIQGISRDITDRKRAEEELLGEKLLSEEYLNSLPGLFYVFDEQRFVRWNSEWNRVTGYSDEELASRYGTDFFEGEDRTLIGERMMKVFREGVSDAEAELVTKDGRRIPYYFTGLRKKLNGREHLIGLAIDISDRKRAEEERLSLERQVQHAQKLESLGVLAGGIAHDFNNLLVAILGNAGLALDKLSPMSPARGNIEEIEKASKRAAELSKQMLAYSGRGRFVVEPIDLGEFVNEMGHLLEVSISKKAVLKYNIAENVPTFDGDVTQIRQVIMNLITNASEAIGDTSGFIVLSTGAMDCDRAYLDDVNEILRASLDEPLPEGVYTSIEVADTGCGMDAETMENIFDPFFTTKFAGRGLGMAAVLGIVRGHKGAIKVYSEVGKGTTFRILFPANESSDEGFAPQRKDAAEERDWQGEGTVLIADDEETVRAVGKEILERMGFSVLTAPDGREALEVFREHTGEINCVLLDLTMPHLDGEQTFREMRRIRADVKVILCSGYNMQDATQRFTGKGLAGFIQKPYTLTTLREKMREVLGS